MQNFSIHEKLEERDLQIMDMSDFYRINLHNYYKRLVVPRQCWPCANRAIDREETEISMSAQLLKVKLDCHTKTTSHSEME